MTAGATYVPIATQTLGSAVSTVTFSSIPSTYTDLILVFTGSVSAGTGTNFTLNGDTGANYSLTYIYGSGSSAGSGRGSNQSNAGYEYMPTANAIHTNITHFMNYANTNTYKTILMRLNGSTVQASAQANLWRSTAAITSIALSAPSANWNTGSQFTLYGIAAA